MREKKIEDIPSAVLQEKSGGANLIADMHNLSVEDLIVVYAYAEAIVETVREPLIILDKELKIKSTNKAFFEMFKVTKEETYNKPLFTLGNGQWDIPELKKLLLDILPRDGQLFDYEVSHNFEEIGKKIILLNARRIVLEGQNTHLILLALEDVTEQRKIEHQKDDFIVIASHELKTPLTTIKLLTQVLKKQQLKGADKNSVAIVEKIEAQVNRLTVMMASFMNVYKLQSSTLELHKTPIDVNKMVSDVVGTFKLISETHKVKLVGKTTKALIGDKERLEQVLINLISNAIKYSPEVKDIVVKVQDDEESVSISVQDFGIGIPKDQQKKIYERFYRVKSLIDKNVEGLGLGLFISNQIVEGHSGEIRLKSTENVGSTFTVVLPYKSDK